MRYQELPTAMAPCTRVIASETVLCKSVLRGTECHYRCHAIQCTLQELRAE